MVSCSIRRSWGLTEMQIRKSTVSLPYALTRGFQIQHGQLSPAKVVRWYSYWVYINEGMNPNPQHTCPVQEGPKSYPSANNTVLQSVQDTVENTRIFVLHHYFHHVHYLVLIPKRPCNLQLQSSSIGLGFFGPEFSATLWRLKSWHILILWKQCVWEAVGGGVEWSVGDTERDSPYLTWVEC